MRAAARRIRDASAAGIDFVFSSADPMGISHRNIERARLRRARRQRSSDRIGISCYLASGQRLLAMMDDVLRSQR
jgi:hypothetical protein